MATSQPDDKRRAPAVGPPTLAEAASLLALSLGVCAAVLFGALGPVWLVVGPTVAALSFLMVGPTRSRLALRSLKQDKLATREDLVVRIRELASLAERHDHTFVVLAVEMLDFPRRRFFLDRRYDRVRQHFLQRVAAELRAAVRGEDVVAMVNPWTVSIAAPMQDTVRGLALGARLGPLLADPAAPLARGTSVPTRMGVAEGPAPDLPPEATLKVALLAAEAAESRGRMVAISKKDVAAVYAGGFRAARAIAVEVARAAGDAP